MSGASFYLHVPTVTQMFQELLTVQLFVFQMLVLEALLLPGSRSEAHAAPNILPSAPAAQQFLHLCKK